MSFKYLNFLFDVNFVFEEKVSMNFLSRMYANIKTMNNNYLEKKQRDTEQVEYCMIPVQNFADKYGKKPAGVTF